MDGSMKKLSFLITLFSLLILTSCAPTNETVQAPTAILEAAETLPGEEERIELITQFLTAAFTKDENLLTISIAAEKGSSEQLFANLEKKYLPFMTQRGYLKALKSPSSIFINELTKTFEAYEIVNVEKIAVTFSKFTDSIYAYQFDVIVSHAKDGEKTETPILGRINVADINGVWNVDSCKIDNIRELLITQP